jgi:hypothetical protein
MWTAKEIQGREFPVSSGPNDWRKEPNIISARASGFFFSLFILFRRFCLRLSLGRLHATKQMFWEPRKMLAPPGATEMERKTGSKS